MKWAAGLWMFVIAPLAAQNSVAGRVVDARGGEPLARVRLRVLPGTAETHTGVDGRFVFSTVEAGAHVLHVETVGYRLVTHAFTMSGAALEFDIALSPETGRRVDVVEVTGGVFESTGVAGGATQLTLNGAEIKNLGTVLMEDPLRAVHALPGVAANNDFQARFTVHGTGFEHIGLYVDDVLMHAPFHAASEGDASMAMVNGEIVSDMTLAAIAPAPNYSDRTGGFLVLRTREGSDSKPSFRFAAGVAGASALGEGPFAHSRGSWIASARKSYVQYLLNRLHTDSALAIGFTDYQGRVSYALTPSQRLSVFALDGLTDLNRDAARARSGVNALITGRTRSSLIKINWQNTVTPKFVVSATAGYIRERATSGNKFDVVKDASYYGEWTGVVSTEWQWANANSLAAGWNIRRLRDDGISLYYINDIAHVRQNDAHRGTGIVAGGYVAENWNVRGLHGTVGTRWDRHNRWPSAILSPHASLAVPLGWGTEVHLGWGQYVQFPELAQWTSLFGGPRIAPERANHFSAALERPLAADARVRIEAWERDDRDEILRPFFDPRVTGGRVVIPTDQKYYSSGRGYSRGMTVFVQRRSANRLSGWVSYTLGYARMRDGVEATSYWALHDQRHLVNSYLSYRLTSSLNLSGRWSYSSGEPVPGYLMSTNGVYYLTTVRNGERMPAYQRADVRVNKSFTYDRWKLTLYGEVINITNHRNMRFLSFDGVNTSTRRASVTIERVFPIVPVAGVTLEF